jgi:hypothetical protein
VSGRAPGAAWRALLLGLSASGCAVHPSLEPAPLLAGAAESEPGAPRAPVPEAPASPLTPLLRRVAALRGLEPGPAPALIVLPARQLARRASQQVARDVPEVVRRAQAQLLWRLGLVERDFELTSALETGLVGDLQAFYAASPPTVYLDRALGGAARQRALAHELVHALQDRHHALVRRLEYAPDAWDHQSALHALAEADALAVVERLELSEAGAPGSFATELAATEGSSTPGSSEGWPAPVSSLPPVLTRALAAPYLDGRARLSALLAQGGFAAVDAELRDPPRSSHELLHGVRAAPAAALPAFALPAPEFRRIYSDVLGEQSLRSVLEEWADESIAAQLAGGWAADRVSTFASSEDTAVAWELHFDRPEGAASVSRLLRQGLHLAPDTSTARARTTGAPPLRTEWACGAHSDSGAVAVARTEERLVMLSRSEVSAERGCGSLQDWLRAAGWAHD